MIRHILVTGGAGYIGSVCTEVLLRAGYQVTVLDSLVEGHPGAVPPGVELYQCDLADTDGLDLLFESSRFDVVCHLAAEALVEKSVQNPSVFYATNVAGGINLLDAMVRHRVLKMIFSSTAAVYGDPRHGAFPIWEGQSLEPINPYGHSKLLFETVLERYRREAGMRYVSLRYFNVAGATVEHGEDRRVETHIIPRLLGQDEFTVCGSDYSTRDGSCVRDYVHVLDVAEAHERLMEVVYDCSGEVFNVGTGTGYSVREIVDAVQRITGRNIRIFTDGRRVGDPATLVASGAKMQRELSWAPKHSDLDNIVRTAWDWKQRFPGGYDGQNKVAVS